MWLFLELRIRARVIAIPNPECCGVAWKRPGAKALMFARLFRRAEALRSLRDRALRDGDVVWSGPDNAGRGKSKSKKQRQEADPPPSAKDDN
jgi:hypothetical protein